MPDSPITAAWLAAAEWRDTGGAWQKTVGYSTQGGHGVAVRLVPKKGFWDAYRLADWVLSHAGRVSTVGELDRLCESVAKAG